MTARRVTATAEALEVIRRLRAAHGPLALHQSAGCCEGSAPICVRAAELPPGPHDVVVGELGGVPYLIDAELDRRWGTPDFFLDVADGTAEGFSLEGLEGVHFVARSAEDY